MQVIGIVGLTYESKYPPPWFIRTSIDLIYLHISKVQIIYTYSFWDHAIFLSCNSTSMLSWLTLPLVFLLLVMLSEVTCNGVLLYIWTELLFNVRKVVFPDLPFLETYRLLLVCHSSFSAGTNFHSSMIMILMSYVGHYFQRLIVEWVIWLRVNLTLCWAAIHWTLNYVAILFIQVLSLPFSCPRSKLIETFLGLTFVQMSSDLRFPCLSWLSYSVWWCNHIWLSYWNFFRLSHPNRFIH